MGLTLSEIWRRVQNIFSTGVIVATKEADGKMLVKVEYDKDTISDWLPVAIKNNSLIKIWMPPKRGEQVSVVRFAGSADGGVVFPSIFNKECKEPEGANEHNVIVEMGDGARFEYDTLSGELRVDAVKKITLISPEIVLDCRNLTVKGDARFNGAVDIDEALEVSGDLGVDGSIETQGSVTDMRGDLTNFKTSNKGVRA